MTDHVGETTATKSGDTAGLATINDSFEEEPGSGRRPGSDSTGPSV